MKTSKLFVFFLCIVVFVSFFPGYSIAATLKLLNVTVNVTSAKVGTEIKWTISSTGGNGNKTYQFWLYKDNEIITKTDFKSSRSFRYTPVEVGIYKVRAFVKDNSSTVSRFSKTTKVTAPKLSVTSVTSNTKSAKVGMEISFKARTKGGSGSKTYMFILYKDGKKINTVNYSSSASFAFSPNEPGTYRVKAYVKDSSGQTANKYSANVSVFEPLNITKVTASMQTATVKTKITWTIKTSGGDSAKKYRFLLYKDDVLSKKVGYSSIKTFSYTPTAKGTYKVRVYAKDSTEEVSRYSDEVMIVDKPKPLAITEVKPDKTEVYTGDTITWKVETKDGYGNKQYRYLLYKDKTLLTNTSFSDSDSFAYIPDQAGVYYLRAYVRDSKTTLVRNSANINVLSSDNRPFINPENVGLLTPDDSAFTHSLRVTANVSWSVSMTVPWITVSPQNGGSGVTEIVISVQKNNEQSARTGQIQFIGDGGAKWTIQVDQSGAIPPSSTLCISDATAPSGNLRLGSSFTLRGVVSSNYTITSLTAGVYDSAGNATSEVKTVVPGATSFNLSAIDADIHFNYLPVGSKYEYRVTASDASETTKTLLSSKFNIVADSTLSISGETKPTGILPQGGSFGLYGVITSNHIITSVTAGVYYQSDGNATNQIKTVYPNAYSCNIRNTIDAYIIFNDLAPGEYIYKVMATSNGITKTLVSSNFSVVAYPFSFPVPGYSFGSHGLYCNCSVHHGTHKGGDIPTGGKRPAIYAVHTGKVTIVSRCSIDDNILGCSCGCLGKGNCIRIVSDDSLYSTVYMHLSSISVSDGQRVSRGQLVGYVGSTGDSSGPHLHLELRINGVLKNPKDFIK